METASRAGRPRAPVTALACLLLLMAGSPARVQGGPDAHITGRVVTRTSKRPIPAVWVIVYENGKVRGRSLTGDDGRYYIAGLVEKSYDLAVMRGRTTLIRRPVRLPENASYDIVIPP
jgi:hypothetical protein